MIAFDLGAMETHVMPHNKQLLCAACFLNVANNDERSSVSPCGPLLLFLQMSASDSGSSACWLALKTAVLMSINGDRFYSPVGDDCGRGSRTRSSE